MYSAPQQPDRKARKQHAGVTLVELLVTVAIIGIIAAIASPALNGFIERQRLRAATEQVLAAVNTARTEATRQSRRLFLGVQAGNNGEWAVGVGDTANCGQTLVNTTTCTVATVVGTTTQNIPYVWSGLVDHNRISLTTNANTASIDPVRGLVSTPVQITLSSPSGWQTQVLFSTLGRATACSPIGAPNVAGLQICPST